MDAALASLSKAVDLGFHDRAMAESDADLGGVRNDPRFARLFDRK